MSGKLIIRTDISVETLRRRARLERDSRVAAIANALDGMSRAEAARAAGMDQRALRDWVIRFNAEGIAGLCDHKRSGPKLLLDQGVSRRCCGPRSCAVPIGIATAFSPGASSTSVASARSASA